MNVHTEKFRRFLENIEELAIFVNTDHMGRTEMQPNLHLCGIKGSHVLLAGTGRFKIVGTELL